MSSENPTLVQTELSTSTQELLLGSLPKKRGGARPGSGRPKGSRNRVHAKDLAKAARTGKLPHMILLEAARNGFIKCGKVRHELNGGQVLECLKAASPYFAPRFVSHEVGGKGGGPLEVNLFARVVAYVPDNARRVVSVASANDARALPLTVHKGNGSGSNGSGGNGSEQKVA